MLGLQPICLLMAMLIQWCNCSGNLVQLDLNLWIFPLKDFSPFPFWGQRIMKHLTKIWCGYLTQIWWRNCKKILVLSSQRQTCTSKWAPIGGLGSIMGSPVGLGFCPRCRSIRVKPSALILKTQFGIYQRAAKSCITTKFIDYVDIAITPIKIYL